MLRLLIGMVMAAALSGTGFCKDVADIKQLARTARGGDVRAMCDLGLAYYHGRGVLKDPFKAKCWVKKAHGLGYKRAETIWNKLELWQYSGNCSDRFDDLAVPAHRAGDLYREPLTGMPFVWVPGLCFKMGCTKTGQKKCGKDALPGRRVCPDGFWMGQYEVTQKEWSVLMPVNPSRFRGKALPVEQVSYHDALAFIEKLNRDTGPKFSLPSRAQWEFACRNRGKPRTYPWGNETFQPKANCGGCNSGRFRGRTAPVGSFPSNELGLYDMGGNVREWCQKSMDGGRTRVVLGGSFVDSVSFSRCRAREDVLPGMKTYFTGFRLVLMSPEISD